MQRRIEKRFRWAQLGYRDYVSHTRHSLETVEHHPTIFQHLVTESPLRM